MNQTADTDTQQLLDEKFMGLAIIEAKKAEQKQNELDKGSEKGKQAREENSNTHTTYTLYRYNAIALKNIQYRIPQVRAGPIS